MSKESEIYVSIYVASQAIVNKENLFITEYLKYFKNVMVCVRYKNADSYWKSKHQDPKRYNRWDMVWGWVGV